MPFVDGPCLAYTGRGRYVTVGVSTYVGNPDHGGDVVTIPGGFETDLATTPRLLWPLLPPHGPWEEASVVHDWLCVQLAEARRNGTVPKVNSRDTDALGFLRIMREGGVGPITRRILWTGVRWGALANPARRKGWIRDAPLVLAISAALLAVTLAAAWAVHAAVDWLLSLL